MKTKTKLVAYLMSVCLVLSFAVIGILAVTSLNMKIGGDINFFAEGVSFSVGEGKFYEENGTTLYTGITSQTGILQGFSMDTDTKLTDVSDELATWTGLDLQLDSRGDAILKFNITNDMDDKELYVLFAITPGTNTNNNMNIVASTSEKISANSSKDITIKFDILDMSINAGLEGFEIAVTFSEPVAVNNAGTVENQEVLNYKHIEYQLNESASTATISTANVDLSGKAALVDRIYLNQKEYVVTEIQSFAFSECEDLISVVIPDTVKIIKESAFSGCPNLEEIIISDSVTTLEEDICSDCYKLENIVLSKNVTRIERYAFAYCAPKTIYIPETVEYIGPYAFQYCEELTSIVIPQNVKKLDDGAFHNCTSLESITLKATVPPTLIEVERRVFNGTNNCPIYVPAGSVEAYKTAWPQYADRIFAI